MRKLCEPNKVAFELENSKEFLEKEEAQQIRSAQFWDYVHDESNVDERNKHSFRKSTIQEILNFLQERKSYLSECLSTEVLYLWAEYDQHMWERIKFIIAFDTQYVYFSEEEHQEVFDYLDEEAAIQFDMMKACSSYILEGAALAKRVGSPAYDKWVDALVMLNDVYHCSQNYKAIDLIAEAYARTWGDVRTWIYINGRDNLAKTKKIIKNKKK